MSHDIISVSPMGEHRLFLRFDNGEEGIVDLAHVLRFDGVFSGLRDPAEVARVMIDPEAGTIVWPNGADLCPDVLFSLLTGAPLPTEVTHEHG